MDARFKSVSDDRMIEFLIQEGNIIRHHDKALIINVNPQGVPARQTFWNQKLGYNRETLEANKGEIEISDVTFEGEIAVAGELVSRSITIRNNSSTVSRSLTNIEISSSEFTVVLPSGVGNSVKFSSTLPLLLRPRTVETFIIQCCAKDVGVVNGQICFNFESFSISRFVSLQCGNADLINLLKPTTKYEKSRKINLLFTRHVAHSSHSLYFVTHSMYMLIQEDDDVVERVEVVDGIRPAGPSRSNTYKAPEQFKVMKELRTKESLGEAVELVKSERETLHADNYVGLFQLLLWLEEIKISKDMLGFNMDGVRFSFDSNKEFMGLIVPGLAESRPSVMVGDDILAKQSNDSSPCYKGYAHFIEDSTVYFKFDKHFHNSCEPHTLYDVQFNFKRTLMRVFHQALNRIEDSNADFNNWLFPSSQVFKLLPPLVVFKISRYSSGFDTFYLLFSRW